MGKNKKNRVNVVYSTNPDFEYDSDDMDEQETLPPEAQTLRVLIDRKGRKGKTATVIEGFVGSADDLDTLCRELKVKCGVGGSAKDGEIVIQGEVRDKVMNLLNDWGYKTKRVGG